MPVLELTAQMHADYRVLEDRMARIEQNIARRRIQRPVRRAAALKGHYDNRGAIVA